MTSYELSIHRFLAVYRFLSFGLAVVVVQVIPFTTTQATPRETIITLTLLGLYSLLKVFSPLRWRQQGRLTLVVLGGDLAICVFLVLFNSGLDSGYLLYSLTPVLTAALLFGDRIATVTAAITAAAPAAAHLGLNQLSDEYAWVLEGNRLALLIVYVAFSFLIATVSFRTNLNIRRRIERDAVLEERRRLRRELHDGVAQALNYLNLKTKAVSNSVSSQETEQALAGLVDIRQTVQSTYEDIRESIDQLSTEAAGHPLLPALESYLREFGQRYGLEVHFDVPKVLRNLSPAAELQLFRIAQEALSNVRKHAGASRVHLSLEDTPQGCQLSIEDNGQGFSLDQHPDSLGFWGLDIMKERAEGLGGTLEVTSAPGEGTTVVAHLPDEKVRL
ncbi:MAG: sensor histidine kinase [Dehalococcoidia bacterium]